MQQLRYMSQVSYGIPWICRIGFPWTSAQQLADFRESSAESSQTIHGNIAGYLRNLCTYLRNDVLKGCRGMFEGDCTAIYARFMIPEDDFADSRRRFCGLDNLRPPKDCLEDSHKTNLRAPERQFRWFPKDDSADPERQFRRLATDDPRISVQTFMEIRGGLLRKSADFCK